MNKNYVLLYPRHNSARIIRDLEAMSVNEYYQKLMNLYDNKER